MVSFSCHLFSVICNLLPPWLWSETNSQNNRHTVVPTSLKELEERNTCLWVPAKCRQSKSDKTINDGSDMWSHCAKSGFHRMCLEPLCTCQAAMPRPSHSHDPSWRSHWMHQINVTVCLFRPCPISYRSASIWLDCDSPSCHVPPENMSHIGWAA